MIISPLPVLPKRLMEDAYRIYGEPQGYETIEQFLDFVARNRSVDLINDFADENYETNYSDMPRAEYDALMGIDQFNETVPGPAENWGRGMAQRGSTLIGGFLQAAASTAQAAGSPEVAAWLQDHSEDFREMDTGYIRRLTWEDMLDSPVTEILPYAWQEGIISAPDIATLLLGVPGIATYITARTGELAKDRAEYEGRDIPTMRDFLYTAPAATVVALSERFGSHKILGIGGLNRLKGKGAKDIATAIGAGAAAEGATEVFQETTEELSRTVNTEKGIDLDTLAQGALQAGTVGFFFGGEVRTGSVAVQVARGKYPVKKGNATGDRLKAKLDEVEPEKEFEIELTQQTVNKLEKIVEKRVKQKGVHPNDVRNILKLVIRDVAQSKGDKIDEQALGGYMKAFGEVVKEMVEEKQAEAGEKPEGEEGETPETEGPTSEETFDDDGDEGGPTGGPPPAGEDTAGPSAPEAEPTEEGEVPQPPTAADLPEDLAGVEVPQRSVDLYVEHLEGGRDIISDQTTQGKEVNNWMGVQDGDALMIDPVGPEDPYIGLVQSIEKGYARVQVPGTQDVRDIPFPDHDGGNANRVYRATEADMSDGDPDKAKYAKELAVALKAYTDNRLDTRNQDKLIELSENPYYAEINPQVKERLDEEIEKLQGERYELESYEAEVDDFLKYAKTAPQDKDNQGVAQGHKKNPLYKKLHFSQRRQLAAYAEGVEVGEAAPEVETEQGQIPANAKELIEEELKHRPASTPALFVSGLPEGLENVEVAGGTSEYKTLQDILKSYEEYGLKLEEDIDTSEEALAALPGVIELSDGRFAVLGKPFLQALKGEAQPEAQPETTAGPSVKPPDYLSGQEQGDDLEFRNEAMDLLKRHGGSISYSPGLAKRILEIAEDDRISQLKKENQDAFKAMADKVREQEARKIKGKVSEPQPIDTRGPSARTQGEEPAKEYTQEEIDEYKSLVGAVGAWDPKNNSLTAAEDLSDEALVEVVSLAADDRISHLDEAVRENLLEMEKEAYRVGRKRLKERGLATEEEPADTRGPGALKGLVEPPKELPAPEDTKGLGEWKAYAEPTTAQEKRARVVEVVERLTNKAEAAGHEVADVQFSEADAVEFDATLTIKGTSGLFEDGGKVRVSDRRNQQYTEVMPNHIFVLESNEVVDKKIDEIVELATYKPQGTKGPGKKTRDNTVIGVEKGGMRPIGDMFEDARKYQGETRSKKYTHEVVREWMAKLTKGKLFPMPEGADQDAINVINEGYSGGWGKIQFATWVANNYPDSKTNKMWEKEKEKTGRLVRTIPDDPDLWEEELGDFAIEFINVYKSFRRHFDGVRDFDDAIIALIRSGAGMPRITSWGYLGRARRSHDLLMLHQGLPSGMARGGKALNVEDSLVGHTIIPEIRLNDPLPVEKIAKRVLARVQWVTSLLERSGLYKIKKQARIGNYREFWGEFYGLPLSDAEIEAEPDEITAGNISIVDNPTLIDDKDIEIELEGYGIIRGFMALERKALGDGREAFKVKMKRYESSLALAGVPVGKTQILDAKDVNEGNIKELVAKVLNENPALLRIGIEAEKLLTEDMAGTLELEKVGGEHTIDVAEIWSESFQILHTPTGRVIGTAEMRLREDGGIDYELHMGDRILHSAVITKAMMEEEGVTDPDDAYVHLVLTETFRKRFLERFRSTLGFMQGNQELLAVGGWELEPVLDDDGVPLIEKLEDQNRENYRSIFKEIKTTPKDDKIGEAMGPYRQLFFLVDKVDESDDGVEWVKEWLERETSKGPMKRYKRPWSEKDMIGPEFPDWIADLIGFHEEGDPEVKAGLAKVGDRRNVSTHHFLEFLGFRAVDRGKSATQSPANRKRLQTAMNLMFRAYHDYAAALGKDPKFVGLGRPLTAAEIEDMYAQMEALQDENERLKFDVWSDGDSMKPMEIDFFTHGGRHGNFAAYYMPRGYMSGGAHYMTFVSTSSDGSSSHEHGHALDFEMRQDETGREAIDIIRTNLKFNYDASLLEEKLVEIANRDPDIYGDPAKKLKEYVDEGKYLNDIVAPTEFHQNALFLDGRSRWIKRSNFAKRKKDHDYFANNEELWARAWEAFVLDLLPGRNDFLVDTDYVGEGKIVSRGRLYYPQGVDRKFFNKMFKIFIDHAYIDDKGQTRLKEEGLDLLKQMDKRDEIERWMAQFKDPEFDWNDIVRRIRKKRDPLTGKPKGPKTPQQQDGGGRNFIPPTDPLSGEQADLTELENVSEGELKQLESEFKGLPVSKQHQLHQAAKDDYEQEMGKELKGDDLEKEARTIAVLTEPDEKDKKDKKKTWSLGSTPEAAEGKAEAEAAVMPEQPVYASTDERIDAAKFENRVRAWAIRAINTARKFAQNVYGMAWVSEDLLTQYNNSDYKWRMRTKRRIYEANHFRKHGVNTDPRILVGAQALAGVSKGSSVLSTTADHGLSLSLSNYEAVNSENVQAIEMNELATDFMRRSGIDARTADPAEESAYREFGTKRFDRVVIDPPVRDVKGSWKIGDITTDKWHQAVIARSLQFLAPRGRAAVVVKGDLDMSFWEKVFENYAPAFMNLDMTGSHAVIDIDPRVHRTANEIMNEGEGHKNGPTRILVLMRREDVVPEEHKSDPKMMRKGIKRHLKLLKNPERRVYNMADLTNFVEMEKTGRFDSGNFNRFPDSANKLSGEDMDMYQRYRKYKAVMAKKARDKGEDFPPPEVEQKVEEAAKPEDQKDPAQLLKELQGKGDAAKIENEVAKVLKEFEEESAVFEPELTPEGQAVNKMPDTAYGPDEKPEEYAKSRDAKLLPGGLAREILRAYSVLEKQVGNIINYVATELGFTPEKVVEVFKPEQRVALAMAIRNHQNGDGFVNGDETGVGKGRVNAAMLLYAWNKGLTPVFVTSGANLYEAMAQDLTDIRAEEVLGRKIKIIATDKDKNVQLDPNIEMAAHVDTTDDAGLEALLGVYNKNQSLGDYDMVFTTYNQMQPHDKKDDLPRHEFFKAVGNKGYIVMDESHKAGGDSEGLASRTGDKSVATFMRKVINAKIKEGDVQGGIMYASATFSKSAAILSLYSSTILREIFGINVATSPDKMEKILRFGGTKLLSALSAAMALDGHYLRRDNTMAGINFDVVNVDIDFAAYDQAVEAMAKINEFHSKFIAGLLSRNKKLFAKKNEELRASNFMKEVPSLMRRIMLSFMAKAGADAALKAIENGEKPVITLANTMNNLILAQAKADGLKEGDPIAASVAGPLLKALDDTRSYELGTRKRVKLRIRDDELSKEALKAYKEVEEFIRNSKELNAQPASPIDYILQKIEEAGHAPAEITGRTHAITYSQDGKAIYRKRKLSESNPTARRKIVRAFNDGSVKALIINRTAGTGISIQSSANFADQSPRRMIMLQPELDVSDFIQLKGRIDRTNQVRRPRYTLVYANVPFMKRIKDNLHRKLYRMSATISGDEEASAIIQTADDVMLSGPYADLAVARFMTANPDVNQQLMEPVSIDPDTGQGKPEDGVAETVTGRLPLVGRKREEQIYEELLRMTKEQEDLAKQAGTYDGGQIPILELDAVMVDQTTVLPPDENRKSNNPWTAGLVARLYEINEIAHAADPKKVIDQIMDNLKAKDEVAHKKWLSNLPPLGEKPTKKEVKEWYKKFYAAISNDPIMGFDPFYRRPKKEIVAELKDSDTIEAYLNFRKQLTEDWLRENDAEIDRVEQAMRDWDKKVPKGWGGMIKSVTRLEGNEFSEIAYLTRIYDEYIRRKLQFERDLVQLNSAKEPNQQAIQATTTRLRNDKAGLGRFMVYYQKHSSHLWQIWSNDSLHVGKEITISREGADPVRGIIAGIEHDPKKHLAPVDMTRWTLIVYTPESEDPQRIPLINTVRAFDDLESMGERIDVRWRTYEDAKNPLLAKFVGGQKIIRAKRVFLEGNLVKGIARVGRKHKLVKFRTREGGVNFAVQMPDDVDWEKMKDYIPLEIQSGREFVAYLKDYMNTSMHHTGAADTKSFTSQDGDISIQLISRGEDRSQNAYRIHELRIAVRSEFGHGQYRVNRGIMNALSTYYRNLIKGADPDEHWVADKASKTWVWSKPLSMSPKPRGRSGGTFADTMPVLEAVIASGAEFHIVHNRAEADRLKKVREELSQHKSAGIDSKLPNKEWSKKQTKAATNDPIIISEMERLLEKMAPMAKLFPLSKEDFEGEFANIGFSANTERLDKEGRTHLIRLSFGDPDAVSTLGHEIIHVLSPRKGGLLTWKEWDVLKEQADKKWINKFHIHERYEYDFVYRRGLKGEELEGAYQEEAIAEAFGAWLQNRLHVTKGLSADESNVLERIFSKMREFFLELMNRLRMRGYTPTVEEIFRNIESGKVGTRGWKNKRSIRRARGKVESWKRAMKGVAALTARDRLEAAYDQMVLEHSIERQIPSNKHPVYGKAPPGFNSFGDLKFVGEHPIWHFDTEMSNLDDAIKQALDDKNHVSARYLMEMKRIIEDLPEGVAYVNLMPTAEIGMGQIKNQGTRFNNFLKEIYSPDAEGGLSKEDFKRMFNEILPAIGFKGVKKAITSIRGNYVFHTYTGIEAFIQVKPFRNAFKDLVEKQYAEREQVSDEERKADLEVYRRLFAPDSPDSEISEEEWKEVEKMLDEIGFDRAKSLVNALANDIGTGNANEFRKALFAMILMEYEFGEGSDNYAGEGADKKPVLLHKLGPHTGDNPFVRWTNPKVEERYQAATRGVSKHSIFAGLLESAARLMGQFQTFEHLKYKDRYYFANVFERLLAKRYSYHASRARMLNNYSRVTKGLNRVDYDTFTRYVMFLDLRWTAELGMDLPFGLTGLEEVEENLAIVEAVMKERPDLMERVALRDRINQQILSDLVHYGVLTEEQAKNPFYYRHMVLEYANARSSALASGKKVKTPFWHTRKGSEKDINANYFEAEGEWQMKAYEDIATAKLLSYLRHSQYNMKGEWKERARAENEANFADLLRREIRKALNLKDDRSRLSEELNAAESPKAIARLIQAMQKSGQLDDAVYKNQMPHVAQFNKFNRNVGISYSYLKKALKSIPPENMREMPFYVQNGIQSILMNDAAMSPDNFGTLQWLANQKALPTARDRAVQLLSSYYRRRAWMVKVTPGYVNPNNSRALIDAYDVEGIYTTWQPDSYDGKTRKLHFFTAKTMSQHLHERMMDKFGELAADNLDVSAEEVHALLQNMKDMTVVGGPMEEFIIHKDLANQLNELHDPLMDAWFDNATVKANSFLKRWMLLNPYRFVKYNINNLTGDNDSLIAAGKWKVVTKKIPQAYKEVMQLFEGGERTEKMNMALDYGVIQSGFTQMEIDQEFNYKMDSEGRIDLKFLDKKLYEKIINAPEKYLDFMYKLTRIRENTYRYAAFLHFIEEVDSGKDLLEIGYGASNPRKLMLLDDRHVLAAKMARDVMGDYSNISTLGRKMSKRTLWFYRWLESNSKRYVGYSANVYRYSRDKAAAQGGAAGARAGLGMGATVATIMTARILAFYMAVQIWNNMFFGDEEDRMHPEDRLRLHLNLGMVGDEHWTVRFSGAMSDFVSTFGLEQGMALFQEYKTGRASMGDIMTAIATAPIDRLGNMVTPMIKVPLELAFGRKIYPDVINPTAIRDRWYHTFQTFSAGSEYQAARRHVFGASAPSRGYLTGLKHTIFYTRDPGHMDYQRMLNMGYEYREKLHGGTVGARMGDKSKAYYNYRQSLHYGDETSAKLALEELKEAGGTKRGMRQSLRRAHPLGMLSRKERREFLNTLSPADMARYNRAVDYYMEVLR